MARGKHLTKSLIIVSPGSTLDEGPVLYLLYFYSYTLLRLCPVKVKAFIWGV